MRRLRRALFRLARTEPMGLVVRLAFAHASALLPVRRVTETDTVIVFEHPAPSWRPHLLLVPKRSVRSFRHFWPHETALFAELVRLAFARAATLGLDRTGFALMINGGAYQDVAQAHLHLAGLDAGLRYAAPTVRPGTVLMAADGLVAFEHPDPRRAEHVVIQPEAPRAWRDLDDGAFEQVGAALAGVGRHLVDRSPRLAAGYTLLASIPPGGLNDPVCFHLVGGVRRETAPPSHGPAPG